MIENTLITQKEMFVLPKIFQNSVNIKYFSISKEISPKSFIQNNLTVLKQNNIYSFATITTSIDDSCLNTLAFSIDSTHRRFYNIEEILSFIDDDLQVLGIFNNKVTLNLNYDINNLDDKQQYIIKSQLDNIPPKIANYLNIQFKNNILQSIDITITSFIYEKI